MESIHVNFDELPTMASAHNSSDPAPTCQTKASVQISADPAPECQTMALEHNSLSPGRKCQENVSHGDKTGTTSNELDLLFSPMFDDLLNGSSKVVSKSSAVSTADAPNQCQQPSAPLNTHTTPAPTCQNPPIITSVLSSKNINQAEPHAENDEVADDEFINIFSTPVQDKGETSSRHASVQISSDPAPECQTMALEHGSLKPHAENDEVVDDEFINIFSTPVQDKGETSSRHVDSSNMHTFNQRYPSEQRWTKDHPLEQVIGNPSQSVRTRRGSLLQPPSTKIKCAQIESRANKRSIINLIGHNVKIHLLNIIKFTGCNKRVLRSFLENLPEHPSDTKVFTMKMEILLEPTSNKLLVGTLPMLQPRSSEVKFILSSFQCHITIWGDLEEESEMSLELLRFDENMRFLFKSSEEREEEDQEVTKCINETPAQKAAKRRKLSEEAQEAEDLRKRLEVVGDEDDDVFIEATPLARKVPVVDYQIVLIDNKPRFKIIKADETHQLYINFTTLLKNFDREDLENLWRIVKDIFSTSKPTNFSDEYLLLTLKTMFEEPDGQDAIWRNQKSVHGLALVKS
nr:hypothetical protein [Tanacetum cinerariifolium]